LESAREFQNYTWDRTVKNAFKEQMISSLYEFKKRNRLPTIDWLFDKELISFLLNRKQNETGTGEKAKI